MDSSPWLKATLVILLIELAIVGIWLALNLPVATHVLSSNLLANPSDPNNWACEHERFANAFGVAGSDGGRLTVDVTKSDGAPAHVLLYQEGIDLRAGRKYALRFNAHASTNLSVSVVTDSDLSDHNTLPLDQTVKSMGLDRRILIGSRWKTYRFIFTARSSKPFHSRVPCFLIGAHTGQIWFDRMSLVEIGR